jgi:hypothetical protein
MKLRTLGFLLLAQLSVANAMELKILTTNGFVGFEPEKNWPVIATQSHLPIAVMAFQIPNAADAASADSTNLAISLFDLGTERGRDGFANAGAQLGRDAPTVETSGSWRILRQEAAHGGTVYTILDGKCAAIADVAVSVRLAWPHLASNPATYDRDMDALFRKFLASVHGQTGPYTPKEGEVVRRPKADPDSRP